MTEQAEPFAEIELTAEQSPVEPTGREIDVHCPTALSCGLRRDGLAAVVVLDPKLDSQYAFALPIEGAKVLAQQLFQLVQEYYARMEGAQSKLIVPKPAPLVVAGAGTVPRNLNGGRH